MTGLGFDFWVFWWEKREILKWPFFGSNNLCPATKSFRDLSTDLQTWHWWKSYGCKMQSIKATGSLFLQAACPKLQEDVEKFNFCVVAKKALFWSFPNELDQNQLDIRNINQVLDLGILHQIRRSPYLQWLSLSWKMPKII